MIIHRLVLPIAVVAVSFAPGLLPTHVGNAAGRGPAIGSPAMACTTAESRQFDFWLGDWELVRSDGVGARVRVTSTHDGCVIREEFEAAPASPLTGQSLASFDPQTRGWKQTWVDNFGSWFAFTGGLESGRMTLTATHVAADGKTSLHRRVWSSITADSFEWSWETSDDGGKTWRSAWQFRGRRVATSDRSGPPADTAALAAFAWLEGRWDGTLPNGMRADITYTDAKAGVIAGIMRLHNRALDTLVMTETILLTTTPEGIVMRARHFSRDLLPGEDSAMTMRYAGGSADSLHFVSTGGQKVDAIYLRRGPDRHIARSIIRKDRGADVVIEMTYRRR